MSALFSPPAKCTVKHFYWLDLARGVAALTVLLWHYQHFYQIVPGENPIVANRSALPLYVPFALFYEYGHYAVQLFWAISGFVFVSVYLQTRATTQEFVALRFARLYPLHLLTLLIVAFLQFVSVLETGVFQIYPYNDLYHFVLNLFFVSHWGFERGNSFNEPIWSVSIEIFIYGVFWVVLPYVFRRGILGPLVMVASFLALIALRVPGRFWECGGYFFLGCAAYVWLVAFQAKNAVNVLSGIAAVMVAAALCTLDGAMAGVGLWLLFPAIVLLAASLDVADRFARGKRIGGFGNLTYGMYLLHIPVQIALLLLLYASGIDPPAAARHVAFLALFIGTVIGLAAVSYRYYELPWRLRLRGWLASSRLGTTETARAPRSS